MTHYLKFVATITFAFGISSCIFVSQATNRPKSLKKSEIIAAIKEKMPDGFVVKSDEIDEKAAKYCIRLVDIRSPHYMKWEDSNGNRGIIKTGFKTVEFWVSNVGDIRPRFWLAPDRGKLFYSYGSTFIYAIQSSAYSSEVIKRKVDDIVEDARWVSGLEGEISWSSWREDIISSLRKLERK